MQEVSAVGLMEVEVVEEALVHLKLDKKINKKWKEATRKAL